MANLPAGHTTSAFPRARILEDTELKFDFNNADATIYYYESAPAELARFDSSAKLGNMADVLKNSVFLFTPPKIIPEARMIEIEPRYEGYENRPEATQYTRKF